jgi:hypothetical protein
VLDSDDQNEGILLKEKFYSDKDEKRILAALGRGLLREFPNPDRVGCPRSGIVRDIAFYKLPLEQAEPWLDHLSSCSPCYRDFCGFRDAYQSRRRTTFLAIAVSVLIVGLVGSWTFIQKQKRNRLAQTALLDLRDRSVTRGIEPGSELIPGEHPLEVSRRVTYLNFYLPKDSREGLYEVRILKPSGEPLLATSGVAKLDGGIMSLQVVVRLARARPDLYVLQVRRSGLERNYSLLILQ